MSLLGPILVIGLTAPYVIARQNTIIMAVAWGVIGGFSITIGGCVLVLSESQAWEFIYLTRP
jgi:hypothetical protein